MAKVKAKAGKLTVEFDDRIVNDARFIRHLARLQSDRTPDVERAFAFNELCDLLFGGEAVDMIMDELAQANDGVCTMEDFNEWLTKALNKLDKAKKS